MNKKKKIIITTSGAGVLLIAGSTLALFNDSIEKVVHQTVGSVDTSVEAEINHTQYSRNELAKALENENNDEESSIINPTVIKILEQMGYLTIGTGSESGFNTFSDIASVMEDGPDNLNPGDNDPTSIVSSDITDRNPGTDHEITLDIKNEGSKSIQTRVLVYVTGTKASGEEISSESLLNNVNVSMDWLNSKSGLTSIPMFNALLYSLPGAEATVDGKQAACFTLSADNKDLFTLLNEIPDNDANGSGKYQEALKKIRNNVSDYVKSGLILSGNPDKSNAETEKYIMNEIALEEDYGTDSYAEALALFQRLLNLPYTISEHETTAVTKDVPSEGSLKLDIGMYSNTLNSSIDTNGAEAPHYADSDASLQGATLNFTVVVQGMQYRNTSDADWEDISTQNFSLTVK